VGSGGGGGGGIPPQQYFFYLRIVSLATELKRDKYKNEERVGVKGVCVLRAGSRHSSLCF